MNISSELPVNPQMQFAHDPWAYEAEEWSRPDEMALFNLLWTNARRELDTRPGSSIIDLCCGTGMSLLGAVSHPNVNVAIGVEIIPDLVRFAKARYNMFSNVHFVCADAARRIFPPAYFDLVIASSAYHHFEDSAKREFLSVCKTLLKQDGRLLLAENVLPPYSNHDQEYDRSVRHLYGGVTHLATQHFPNLPNAIRRMLEEDVALSIRREHEFKVDRRQLLDDLSWSGLVVENEIVAWNLDPMSSPGVAGNVLFILRK
jgi:SAM-dependent methyltransferase